MELAMMSRCVVRKASSKASAVRHYSIVHDVPRVAASLSQNPPPAPTQGRSVFDQAVNASIPRNNWTKEEITEIHRKPLMELAFAASSRYKTNLQATKLSTVDSVIEAAKVAKANGSNRFCMGAAWRDMRGRTRGMKNIVEMVKGVRALGMEACVTLGMLDKQQARELKEAGLTAYNHNVDTSREHYPNVITTRSYDERLQTLENVREAGIHVCSGGILGLGETPATDHVGLIYTLATLPEHPESFPVNKLVPIKGTPMFGQDAVKLEDMVRCIATARLVMPKTIIRIAAGRVSMPESEQMLCFMAGANAIFTGEKMLTTDCNGWEQDKDMFERWGLTPMQTEASKLVEVPEEPKFESSSFAHFKETANGAEKGVEA
ncbi:Biotin synthase, mitochondrial [Cladophialophora carrionii]|uniref:Biotin synthase, mitochondrial n=1 Tax=Cladophialophora carrionii TaxID=86049 RepID=A0A1C1CC09_9EURO|nr:Biotin synthase, mitochondrial [Cladophialophora carrionii]